MTKGKNQWVVRHGNEWGVRGEKNSKVTVITPTQREAIDTAREIARHQESELIIQGRHGQIRDKDSHGHDPCPPKDKD
jgi:Uncharacterized protein conserved in bacteria (DUF2188)